jgi:hypothetical protein
VRFSQTDIERWVKDGLITSAQRDAILADLSAHPARAGLDLTTLLYYGGGLLVLLAYSIFLGFQWPFMNSGARVAISGASIVFYAGAATVLTRQAQFRLPGELLQVVSVAVVPLFVFALLDIVGLWPHAPHYYQPPSASHDYELHLAWARMALAGSTLIAAAGAFWWSRSPFVLVAAIVSVTSLCVDVTLQFDPNFYHYELHASQTITIALMGAATLAGGIAARGRTERDYSLWLYIAGMVGLVVGLGSQAIPSDAAPGWGILWLMVALGILGLSLVLQERLFAAAGLAGVFAYFAKLVFDVFQSANAALALVVLGLLVLGVGMLYQRYNERLFSRPA